MTSYFLHAWILFSSAFVSLKLEVMICLFVVQCSFFSFEIKSIMKIAISHT